MFTTWEYPCKDNECEFKRCSHKLIVTDAPYEDLQGNVVYPGMCHNLSAPETFEIPAAELEAFLRERNQKKREDEASTSGGNPNTAPQISQPHNNVKASRGRRGSGLKGNRTRRMADQLAEFKTWLCDNPVNERDPARTVGARANTYWRQHEKTMARDAKRTGEKRGFSSAKTLASAYRNVKA